jgi:prepilin peptidase CpaA
VGGPHVFQLATVAVASVAAALDWRTGRIPNWLTLGAIVAAVPLHAWLSPSTGPDQGPLAGIKWSLLGAVACALPTVVAFWFGWMAGGDVKLVAAMGALSGLSLGLEAVFLAFFCAAAFLVLRLAWTGEFFRTVSDQVTMTVGRAVGRTRADARSNLRFGPFALTGAALSLVLHGGLA